MSQGFLSVHDAQDTHANDDHEGQANNEAVGATDNVNGDHEEKADNEAVDVIDNANDDHDEEADTEAVGVIDKTNDDEVSKGWTNQGWVSQVGLVRGEQVRNDGIMDFRLIDLAKWSVLCLDRAFFQPVNVF